MAIGQIILGDGNNNVLSGTADDDTLDAGAGNDALEGGEGIDSARYASAAAAVATSLNMARAQKSGGAMGCIPA
jgi:Ca2+-binding RTX toxin-like protein